MPDTWDRYGYMGGSNFADVPSTGKYTYSERAIPYVENEAAYHTGTFNDVTYFDKIDAIKNGDIDTFNELLHNCKFRFIGSPIPLATDQCFWS